MPRWLLSLVTMLALLGQVVTSYAAAGSIGESSCCCPQPAKCKCHDHDKDAAPDAKLKRCGGEAKIVAPAVATAIPSLELSVTDVVRVRAPVNVEPLPIRDQVTNEPETPPF